ncbi:MAG: VOC family protein [Actinomycetota bacterium]|nr:VOC family protein [Actinomycetota bacterium]
MTEPVLKMITLDCADARKSGEFWAALLGWELVHAEDAYAMVTGPATTLGFGTVPDYEPPAWPNERGSKQFHFDLACDDIATTEQRARDLGATLAEPQPGDTWRVLVDPGGHPFCLTDAANW